MTISMLNHLSAHWLTLIASRLLDGSVLFVVVSAIWLIAGRRLGPAFGVLLFGLVLLKSCIPLTVDGPWICSLASPSQLLIGLVQPVESPRSVPIRAPAPATRAAKLNLADQPIEPIADTKSTDLGNQQDLVTSSLASLSLTAVLFVLWSLVVSIGLLLFIRSHWLLRKFIRRCPPLDPSALGVNWPVLCRQFGRRSPIAVRLAENLHSPACTGFLKPVILLPSHLRAELSKEQWRWVLAHELEHVRRHDVLWLTLERLARIFYFFHPAVWLASARMEQLREEACDAAALSRTGDANAAGKALVQLAEHQLRSRVALVPLSMLGSGKSVKRRVQRLLAAEGAAVGQRPIVASALLIGAALALVPTVRATAPIAFAVAEENARDERPVADKAVAPEKKGARQSIEGTVIDVTGAPVENAKVADRLMVLNGKLHDFRGVTTNARGEFSLPIGSEGRRNFKVAAVDAAHRHFGWATIDQDKVTIQLQPMSAVRLSIESNEVPMNQLTVFFSPSHETTPDFRVVIEPPTSPDPTVYLPADTSYGLGVDGKKIIASRLSLHVPKGARMLDLGTIVVRANFGYLFGGKEPPAWHITNAVNLSRSARLADLRGQWVLLTFVFIPETERMNPQEEIYRIASILAEVEQFRMPEDAARSIIVTSKPIPLTQKLPPSVSLLVDRTGQTFERFRAWQRGRTVLVDPEGRVVPDGSMQTIVAKLGLTPSSKTEQALGRPVAFDFIETPLRDVLGFMRDYTALQIDIDWVSCHTVGVDAATPITLSLNYATLRSALGVVLETRNLMFETTDDAIRIRARQGEEPYPTSESQQVLNGMAKELLRQTKVSLTTDQTPLTEVAKTLSQQISFNIVIDTESLEKAGKDADLPVTFEMLDVPLFELLDHLCQQAGLSWHFHNEVILITARPKG